LGFQILIGLDNYFSKEPLCPFGFELLNEWNLYSGFAVLGGFVILWIILFSRFARSSYLKDRAHYIVYLNIASMGMITAFLSFTLNWGGLCIDNFGLVLFSDMFHL